MVSLNPRAQKYVTPCVVLGRSELTRINSQEQLQVAARKYYRQYQSALTTLSASASSAASSASAAASTAVYGDKKYQASKSASSVASQASKSASSFSSEASKTATSAYYQASDSVVRAAQDSKDYVYDTWNDNEMRTWLEEHGYIRTKSQVKRDELIAKMNQYYAAATTPVYNAWSDSYIREW